MPRRIARAVVGSATGVLGWRPVGDRLRLSVVNADSSAAELRTALREAGAEVSILRHAKPTMEDVFIHNVEDQRGRHD
ncbi:MAG: hypothetical protein HY835_06310 [Anaerolineae bacterium]|nr:hypothetical protein [Anaerolineae bacterium]